MKRTCNELERELLFNNKEQLLTGIYQTTTPHKYSNIIVGIFVSTIFMFAGIVPIVNLFDDWAKIAFAVWAVFSFSVPNAIVSVIMNRSRAKKEAKAFLKKDNLMVNGATVVEVDLERGKFTYIEDDFVDEDGNPILVDYPAVAMSFVNGMIGKRLIVMYDEDTFQLMVVNDELRGIVPSYSEQYPLAKELDEYMRVPHPNARDIDYKGHVPTESEKENFADMYVKAVQGDAFKVMKISGSILFVCMIIICAAIGWEENCIPKAFTIGLASYIGLILFVLLMRAIGKVNLRKQGQFTYVQEIILYANQIKMRGEQVMTALWVYEWKDGRFELGKYPAGNVPMNAKYGSVLYKFTNVKGNPIFIMKK